MPLIKKRKLKDGVQISVLAAGGLMFSGIPQKQVDEIVEHAIFSGVNFFDVAPTYGDAEIKLGKALFGKRNDILLSCKTTRRDKNGAMAELKQSMKNLKTDHFDFYIMHGIKDIKKDVEPAFSKDGMLMTAVEAKKQGIVLRVGFSAHNEETAIFALENYDFDFVMFPINIFCFLTSGFGSKILRLAREKNFDIIGIKVLAMQKWQNTIEKQKYPNCWYQPLEDKKIIEIAISWALNQNIVSVIPPADINLFKTALEIIKEIPEFNPLLLNGINNLLLGIVPIFP